MVQFLHMENPNFLKIKYNLHNTPEVESAARKTEVRTEEKVPQNPEARIQNYLDRLENLILDPENKQERKEMADGSKRSRATKILREMVMNEYVRPNKDKLAQGAAMVEERAARQMGINMQYDENQLAERGEIAVKDLESSLDQWISYLSDRNEPYPMWFRYYAFRNILELGEYDKDKQEFPKRTAGTNRLFPDIDRGALARIEDVINCSKDSGSLEKFRKAQKENDTPFDQLLTAEKAKAFTGLSFAKQYAESIKESGEITPEMRAETNGEWKKYSQGSDPTALWASLQNKGTAWCTKGFATAETQLKGGDFYVYYTLDKQGKPKIPRIAIRMQNGEISETRGVLDSKQNLEGNMTDIAEAKMNELPGKEKYQKVSADMKQVTSIWEKTFKEDRKTGEKTSLNPNLSKEELIFLYEIKEKIEGFGYQRDPRIAEILATRNPKEDAPIFFDCAPKEIAWEKEDIHENTKAYVGQLFPGIFKKNIEHIFINFPEEKMEEYHIKIGGKNRQQLEKELERKNIEFELAKKNLLSSEDFTTLENEEECDLIKLTVKDLGFPSGATTEQIFEKAIELGLELCPAEVGPQLRLQSKIKDWTLIAMKQIADRRGYPSVFDLDSRGGQLLLLGRIAWSGKHWRDRSQFVFRLRPSTKT